jgi:hypothetical protein
VDVAVELTLAALEEVDVKEDEGCGIVRVTS